jgi:hypothetical protein
MKLPFFKPKPWPPCRWLVLRDNTVEPLETQMRLDWLEVWG